MQCALQPAASNLVMDVAKALNGEYNAIHFYEKLAQLAPNEEMRNRIVEIRKDEMRHYHGVSYIFICLTGQHPTPQLIEALPTDFKQGILTAFHDEQNTVEFYHRVARETNIPYIYHQFTANAADEQNHAVWFLYFMNHC